MCVCRVNRICCGNDRLQYTTVIANMQSMYMCMSYTHTRHACIIQSQYNSIVVYVCLCTLLLTDTPDIQKITNVFAAQVHSATPHTAMNRFFNKLTYFLTYLLTYLLTCTWPLDLTVYITIVVQYTFQAFVSVGV